MIFGGMWYLPKTNKPTNILSQMFHCYWDWSKIMKILIQIMKETVSLKYLMDNIVWHAIYGFADEYMISIIQIVWFWIRFELQLSIIISNADFWWIWLLWIIIWIIGRPYRKKADSIYWLLFKLLEFELSEPQFYTHILCSW